MSVYFACGQWISTTIVAMILWVPSVDVDIGDKALDKGSIYKIWI